MSRKAENIYALSLVTKNNANINEVTIRYLNLPVLLYPRKQAIMIKDHTAT